MIFTISSFALNINFSKNLNSEKKNLHNFFSRVEYKFFQKSKLGDFQAGRIVVLSQSVNFPLAE